ncbi:MAG: RNA-binding protein [Deltaproteobacteria bacterium HGW-Deltaproteobacteria-4]|nr:MAG: RNA-binding protein [Deltaproteobacteria bacterium HGW-Deltaproteobacteria-4]
MEEFALAGHEFIELHKLLKVTSVALSGGEAKVMVAEGLVTVDGVVELRKRCKIHSGQTVECNGTTITVVA